MRLQEVTSYNLKSQTILNESWDMLTESQRLHVGAWEKRVWPLMEQLNTLLEAQLTADQIQSIFANAEKVSIEGGKNRTALGKAGKVTSDAANKVKAEIDKLLKQAANSEPVKNMDAQFDKLRTELANKVKTMPGGDKILAGVDKWKTFANNNPASSAFIIGAMTSLLAFASGGIMSGAAIGLFLRLANNTIKGDKFSTALGKSVKTAAIGAFAGALGDVMSDAVDVAEPAVEGGAQEVTAEVSSDEIANAAGNDAEEVTQAISEMTADEYKLQYAQKIAENFNNMSEEMIQKIADNVVLEGQYPDDFNARFDGTVVRGNIYLTMEEANAFDKFVNNNDPFGPRGILGNETTEWLKQNVEGMDGSGPNVVPDTPDDDLDAAIGGDAPAPGEGFTTDSGATYSKEDLQNLIQQAAEKGEVPDISSLVDSKDIDAGSYADDVSAIETELRELGIDPLKVPDEDALKAVGIEDAAEVDTNTVRVMTNDGFKDLNKEQILQGKEDGSIKRSIANKMLRKLEMQAAAESVEDRLYDEFALYEASLQEGPLGNAAKGFAKSVGGVVGAGAKAAASGTIGAVKKGAAAVGKELGQKITARKLNKMWKAAGSPTDTGAIADILSQAGLSDEEIGTVGQTNKVDLKTTQEPTSQEPDDSTQDNIPPEQNQEPQQTNAPQVDLKALADQIKKAGVAKEVKKQLANKAFS